MSVVCKKETSVLNVETLLQDKISSVITAIENTKGLTIDGVLEDDSIKVINEELKIAFAVSLDAVVFTPVKDLIEALKTGIFERVYSVTRIVGYYSRISGWNASKIGELRDRMKGNYWTGLRVNSEKSRIFEQKQAPIVDRKILSVK